MRGREQERTFERLRRLYEISKRLARLDDIQATVPQVLALVSESVPLRSAILVIEEQYSREPLSRAIAWHTEGVTASRLRYAKSRATAAYAYLSTNGSPVREEDGSTSLPSSLPPPPDSHESRFVLLPLVVDQGRIFGALQIESASPLDEADLLFVNATVGQLAIALDRKAVVEARQGEAREREAAAQFLSEVSVTVLSSLEYDKTITAIVHAPVPQQADICFFDEVHADGAIDRVAAAFADPAKRLMAVDVQHFARATRPGTPPAEALRTGQSILVRRPSLLDLDSQGDELLFKLGVRSMMTVPLFARGQTLGALTFLRTRAGALYSADDLHVAEEIGVRAGMAIDNARLYEKAKQAIEAKERAVEARETLLAMVAHDLRNPLATVVMSTALLLRPERSHEREADRKVAEKIERAAERMNRLIGDLLDIASLEAGRLKVDLKPHPVIALVEEAAEAHEATSLAKGLRLERDAGADLVVCCDRERVLEVLGNLLENAIKFTVAGGSIQIRAVARGDEVLFSVADTGGGIAPEELSRVFDRFWQARRTSRVGSGLGLSISKGLVETHGGKLWVESQLGEGSTFFFTLPTPNARARAAATAGDTKEHIEPASSHAESAHPTVLVVDDDADVRETLGEMLEYKGYEVVIAANGAEALDYLRRAAPPSLILLDLAMPVMDGWAFLEQRNRDVALRAVPVLVISGERNAENKLVEAHADYLEKPVRLDRLLEAMTRMSLSPPPLVHN